MRHLPNALTLFNLFCGCLAVTFIWSDRPILTVVAIVLGLIADFLDGFAARRLHQTSAIGRDLDSLADVVSFGVVPSTLYYHLLISLSIDPWISLVAYSFALGAAYRLARFNTDTTCRDHFAGLPTPAAATFPAGLYWLYHTAGCIDCRSLFLNPPVVFGSLILLVYLMVSSLPHLSFKTKASGTSIRMVRWVLLIGSLLSIVLLRDAAISFIVVLYIFLSLVHYSIKPTPTT